MADLEVDAAAEAVEECRRAGAEAMEVACDLTDRASVDAAVGAGVERFGRLDVLVNAAGGDRKHPAFPETQDEAWETLLDLNLTGVVRSIRAALPHLFAAPGGGNVVTIGSVNGLMSFGSEPYSTAKAGLQNLTANLAAQYGGRQVRFNLIAPGTVRTRVWDNQPGALDQLTPGYPLGRVGNPSDIAAAVAFLASDDADWITGVVLPVDGGITATGAFGNFGVSGTES